MHGGKKFIALILPPALAYSRRVSEGFLRLAPKDWTVLEIPYVAPGQMPLSPGGRKLDAVVTLAEPRDRWLLELVAGGTRVVNLGREWLDTPGVASVHVDRAEINGLLIDHLKPLRLRTVVGMGHRLAQRPAQRRALDDLAGLARCEGMSGLVWSLEGEGPPALLPDRLLRPESEVDLAGFLRGLPLPAAICCASDHMAFIVCEVAARVGLRIPRDLAVIGFGDDPLGTTTHPPLTSVDNASQATGSAASRLLAQWFETGRMPPEPVVISGARLVVRASTTGSTDSATIEIVRRMIENDALHGLSITKLVAASGLSPKTLMRRYRAAFDADPGDEIDRRRLGEAKRLLAQGNAKIADVSAACGFSSQAAFNNYFRRHAGCSPSHFRASAAGQTLS